mmetsp:Transcript_4181/g.17656  ORF Transcript_4181/g.17656 Transcript_4181/m.17656 type:complete len:336 (+) Transcript_4181:463-1470(+)
MPLHRSSTSSSGSRGRAPLVSAATPPPPASDSQLASSPATRPTLRPSPAHATSPERLPRPTASVAATYPPAVVEGSSAAAASLPRGACAPTAQEASAPMPAPLAWSRSPRPRRSPPRTHHACRSWSDATTAVRLRADARAGAAPAAARPSPPSPADPCTQRRMRFCSRSRRESISSVVTPKREGAATAARGLELPISSQMSGGGGLGESPAPAPAPAAGRSSSDAELRGGSAEPGSRATSALPLCPPRPASGMAGCVGAATYCFASCDTSMKGEPVASASIGETNPDSPQKPRAPDHMSAGSVRPRPSSGRERSRSRSAALPNRAARDRLRAAWP